MPWQRATNSAVHRKVPAWLTRAPRLHLEREAQHTGGEAGGAAGASTARGAFWSLFPQGSCCRAKRDLLCTYPSVCLQRGLRESSSGSGWGPGGRTEQGDWTRAQAVPVQSTPRRHHPIAPLWALCHRSFARGVQRGWPQECIHRECSRASSSSWGASLGTVGCSGVCSLHTLAVLLFIVHRAANPCSPSGCSISLDQK